MKKILGIITVIAVFAIPAILFFAQNSNETSDKNQQSLIGQGDAEFVVGEDYVIYGEPLATSQPDKIEVIDLFWYGCPSCYRFKDDLENWRKQLGNDVVFIRKPVAMRRDWENHGRLWLAAKELGLTEKLHNEVFVAIHKERQGLNSIGSITDFFVKHGVDELKFKRLFNSPRFQNQLATLNKEMRQYKPKVTPSLVINGRYLISGTNDNQKMLKIADYLIAKERLAKKNG